MGMIFGFSTLDQNVDEGLDYAISSGMRRLEMDLMSEKALVATADPARIETLRQRAVQGNGRLSLGCNWDLYLREIRQLRQA